MWGLHRDRGRQRDDGNRVAGSLAEPAQWTPTQRVGVSDVDRCDPQEDFRVTFGQVQEISRARIVQAMKALHSPYDVYEACGHNHALNDPNAWQVDGLGMVC